MTADRRALSAVECLKVAGRSGSREIAGDLAAMTQFDPQPPVMDGSCREIQPRIKLSAATRRLAGVRVR